MTMNGMSVFHLLAAGGAPTCATFWTPMLIKTDYGMQADGGD